MVLEPGMEVECISLSRGITDTLIHVGGRYIVEEVYPAGTFSYVDTDQISLVGIRRPDHKTAILLFLATMTGIDAKGAPTTFEASCFRPIKKTDISVFEPLKDVVAKTKVPEGV